MEIARRDDVRKALEEGSHMLLLNTLPKELYEKEHIPGSRNVPYNDNHLVERVSNMVGGNKKHKIVTYCADKECHASDKAAQKLEESGFTNVYDYEDGMADWKEADLPVARIAA